LLIACNPKVPLYTTGTAGKLDDTTVSAGFIQGIVANTSATSASAPYCMVNNAGLMTWLARLKQMPSPHKGGGFLMSSVPLKNSW
jgi:hypothetical protein